MSVRHYRRFASARCFQIFHTLTGGSPLRTAAETNPPTADSRSVPSAESLHRVLQIAKDITANIFRMINSLAIEAIQSGREQITN